MIMEGTIEKNDQMTSDQNCEGSVGMNPVVSTRSIFLAEKLEVEICLVLLRTSRSAREEA